MDHLTSIGLLAGGLGLFLLGMAMMTDGLKLAAGPALDRILAAATRTRWHALGSGVLVTAIVQSSSAVTVAAIGFVNAGILGLAPALWVLFGANVGTTMTGWIVALIGLKFKVEALALPLIGAGMLMRLGAERQRRAALGTALAGFGLLFLGIATLQQSFSTLSGQIDLPQGEGFLSVLAQLGIGILLTVLMQSSSASMTIALTAAQGGLLDAQGAAAVVIGSNIGTTVTAILATIGATSNARRAAAAHVAFNLLTGVVALLLLPWLVDAIAQARAALGMSADPAVRLAIFHTSFNLLGVLLMWPLAASLTQWLLRRFRAREENEAQPQHLDETVLAVPALALKALQLEVARVGQMSVRTVRAVLAGRSAAELESDRVILSRLDAAVQDFIERMNRSAMPQAVSEQLAKLLRIQRYHESSVEHALAVVPLAAPVGADAPLTKQHAGFVAAADALFGDCEAVSERRLGAEALGRSEQAMESAYQSLKAALLAAGAAGRLQLAKMEDSLRLYSSLRRSAQQALKARQRQVLEIPD